MEKNEIILQLKAELFELEQKIECMENLENSNKNLKCENLALLSEKNQCEFEIKKLNDYYTKLIKDLQTELNTYKGDVEMKKSTNKQLFDENEQLKLENKKLKEEMNKMTIDYEVLIEKQSQYEQTIHNMSQIQIDIKKENENLVRDNKNLVKVCKELSRKSNQPMQNTNQIYSEIDKLSNIKNCLINENSKLKNHILVLTDQNQNVCK